MDDERIIDLYWQRSENAVEETYKKYSSYCNSISFNILQNKEDAEECVNDTFQKAWDCIPPNRPQCLKAFLGKIARNISINRLKGSKVRKRGSGQVTLVMSELDECIPNSFSVEEAFSEKQLSQAINRFLGELPTNKCRIFVSRYWYMRPIKDIAEQYGMGEGKVKSILFRIRKQLKVYFMKSEDLLKAINEIDDKYLLDADNAGKENTDNENNHILTDTVVASKNVSVDSLKHHSKLRIAGLIAACLCIIVAVGVVVSVSNKTGFSDDKLIKNNQSRVGSAELSEDSFKQQTGSLEESLVSKIESQKQKDESKENKESSQNEVTNPVESSVESGVTNPNADFPYVSESSVTASQGEVSEISNSEDGGDLLSHDYKPDTLGDFVKDLQLKDTLEIIGGTYVYQEGNYIHTTEINGDNSAFVFDILLTDECAKNYGEIADSTPIIEVGVCVPELNCINCRLWVTESGYVCTDILGSQKSFFIGKDKVQAFVDYVKENCEVKELLFDKEKDDYVYDNDLTSQIKSE